MHNEIPKLDKAELRKFGITSAIIVMLIFGIVFPLVFGHGIILTPWVISVVLIIWALAAPQSMSFLYKAWMKFGLVAGWINTRIILGIVFYIIITPVGFLMRILGKNPLKKAHEVPNSYRIVSRKQVASKMEKPY